MVHRLCFSSKRPDHCICVTLQECLRACQESIEQMIHVHLETLVREHDRSGNEVKALQSIVSQSTTPTDVRDVSLMVIDEENQFHME